MTSLAMADNVYNVPFVDKFDANTHRDEYTTIDANGDGNTIKRHYQTAIIPGFFPDTDFHEMEYDSNRTTKKADDWFITPKIHLEAGMVYSFSIDAQASFDSFAHNMEVLLGTDDKASAMNTPILGMTSVSSSDRKNFSNEFSVEESGEYRIGIHITSEPDRGSIYFTNISIKNASSTNVPAQVSDLTVTPDPTGALKAQVSFTIPLKNIDGSSVKSITKVEISRGEALVATLKDLAPGESVVWTDNNPRNGFNDYTVVVYNSNGKGLRSYVKNVYIGVDVPLPPQEFSLRDLGDRIALAWSNTPSKGKNGMIVNPANTRYFVEELNSSYTGIALVAETRDNSAEYQCNTFAGAQDIRRFGIRAINDAGWSDYQYASIVTGAPYNLPFHESFATGVSHGLLWQEGIGSVFVDSSDAADNDAGCIVCMPLSNSSGVYFNLGKFNFRQALHPVLTFKCKGEAVITMLSQNMDAEIVEHARLNVSTKEWKTFSVDLSKAVGETYVIPKFLVAAESGSLVLFDEIEIRDLPESDLGIEIDEVSQSADKESVEVSCTVTNEGMTDAAGIRLVCTVGSEVVEIPVADIKAGMQRNLVVKGALSECNGEYIPVTVQLFYELDMNPDNNKATALVAIDRAPASIDGTNGIADLESGAVKQGNEGMFTLDGRRVSAASAMRMRTIYIKGGKKYVMK